VITQGANIGLSWYFYKEHAFTFNYSYNKLAKSDEDDPIIPAFNTPLHKFNFGFNGRDLFKAKNGNSWGYGANYKWVDKYFWEGSPQFTGPVNAFTVVDAQVNYTLVKQNINIKLGCSNLLNNLHIEAYGGPQIGRLAYICLLYEWQKNK
jgi:iron complex outermembrane recepter protein